mmetsp:Transcript_95024/g.188249  ORF Transcript_95024/g.188249 Transcript_95024/m.188249 type:complete len:90 (+) Transcript_95024:93-362(+)|eukprot:CAMPEP_0172714756 /NCGR_PEP_ID=MMETSP1074-20121228/66703_1 /TAXON_ID=2916 /ORGANISM="Ceratium fusus, Strain PA161109" /LENGTH=89 /DNA_ID=CAMNT_0013539239 /DNA_START=80 /DNA_END=349 /DNA_ORIENTATION=-
MAVLIARHYTGAIAGAEAFGDADFSCLDKLDSSMPPLARQTPGWLDWSFSTLTVGVSESTGNSDDIGHVKGTIGLPRPILPSTVDAMLS